MEAQQERREALARAEKDLGRRISLGGYRWGLVLAIVVWVAALLSPHTGGVRGYDVLLLTDTAASAHIKVTEYLFVIATSCAAIASAMLLVLPRAVVGSFAWFTAGLASFSSILGLWLRLTRPDSDGTGGPGLGMYLMVVAAVIALMTLSMTVWSRSSEQRELARQRASTHLLDEVGAVQAQNGHERPAWEDNPLFVDDRRQRAAQRHRPTAH